MMVTRVRPSFIKIGGEEVTMTSKLYLVVSIYGGSFTYGIFRSKDAATKALEDDRFRTYKRNSGLWWKPGRDNLEIREIEEGWQDDPAYI